MRNDPAYASASPVDLVKRLVDQSSILAKQELALVQAEMGQALDDIKLAMGSLVGAAVVGISGLGILLLGFVYLLSETMDPWLAAFIVAAVTLIIAGLMYAGAKKKMDAANLKPTRTIRTIEATPDAITPDTRRTN